MKFRRKPVTRDTVDAIRETTGSPDDAARIDVYILQHADGKVTRMNVPDFERDYAPVRRERTKKAAKGRGRNATKPNDDIQRQLEKTTP